MFGALLLEGKQRVSPFNRDLHLLKLGSDFHERNVDESFAQSRQQLGARDFHHCKQRVSPFYHDLGLDFRSPSDWTCTRDKLVRSTVACKFSTSWNGHQPFGRLMNLNRWHWQLKEQRNGLCLNLLRVHLEVVAYQRDGALVPMPLLPQVAM